MSDDLTRDLEAAFWGMDTSSATALAERAVRVMRQRAARAATAARAGSIVVRARAAEVLEAPERALISLEVVNKADHSFRVDGDKIHVGDGASAVTYQVIGWDPGAGLGAGLIVERTYPPIDETSE